MRHRVAGFALLALVTLAACGGAVGGDDTQAAEGEASMRFVFSPDPCGTGSRTRHSRRDGEEAGVTIERYESEDEFAFFAGGHADIVSTGSYETPVLESETDVQTVTIGKYNKAKDIVVVAADRPYETFGDLRSGCKVGVESFSGSTIVWRRWRRTWTGGPSARGPKTSRWRSPTSTWHPNWSQGRPVRRRYLDLQHHPVLHERRSRACTTPSRPPSCTGGVRAGPRGDEQQ